jgi:hypothetical protein
MDVTLNFILKAQGKISIKLCFDYHTGILPMVAAGITVKYILEIFNFTANGVAFDVGTLQNSFGD